MVTLIFKVGKGRLVASNPAAYACGIPRLRPPLQQCWRSGSRIATTRRSGGDGARAAEGNRTAPAGSLVPPDRWDSALLLHAAVMAASAVLGPLCDGLHSKHGVLEYTHPLHIGLLGLDTTWWTPLLFALAGVILGVSHPWLDAWLPPQQEPRGGRDLGWPFVLAGITSFVLQYYASAMLEGPLLGVHLGAAPALDVLLCGGAAMQWAALDGTRQGLLMVLLTAAAGPAIEVTLIHQGLYSYAHPQLLDAIPSWIPFVYAGGSPAVGNLGRKVWAALLQRRRRLEQAQQL